MGLRGRPGRPLDIQAFILPQLRSHPNVLSPTCKLPEPIVRVIGMTPRLGAVAVGTPLPENAVSKLSTFEINTVKMHGTGADQHRYPCGW